MNRAMIPPRLLLYNQLLYHLNLYTIKFIDIIYIIYMYVCMYVAYNTIRLKPVWQSNLFYFVYSQLHFYERIGGRAWPNVMLAYILTWADGCWQKLRAFNMYTCICTYVPIYGCTIYAYHIPYWIFVKLSLDFIVITRYITRSSALLYLVIY